MQLFYWLVDGILAGCSLPGQRQASRTNGSAALDEDLFWLKTQGIGAILSLTEEPLGPDALERNGLEALHLPVPDLTPPLPEQLQKALEFIDWHAATGTGVAVHCLMGQGRTGTVLAAYLIRSGVPAEEAIDQLRSICPGALSSPSQETALHAFATRRDWIL